MENKNLIDDVLNFSFIYKNYTVFATSNYYDGEVCRFIVYRIKNDKGNYLKDFDFLDKKDEIKEQFERNKTVKTHIMEMIWLSIFHHG